MLPGVFLGLGWDACAFYGWEWLVRRLPYYQTVGCLVVKQPLNLG